MSMMALTPETLSEQIGETVTELHVIIAKNQVVGLEPSQIADLLGVTVPEIHEIQADPVYRDVRLLLASEHAKTQVDTDLTWDDVEATALRNLSKRVKFEQDTETLLKIAAVANKAQRRNNTTNKVLDPSQGKATVPLTLTRRIVSRLNAQGDKEVVREEQISVLDGSATNPSFADIDQMLGVTSRPTPVPGKMAIATRDMDFSVDDLEFPEASKAMHRLMKP